MMVVAVVAISHISAAQCYMYIKYELSDTTAVL